jgi:serine/threonine-protein kinase
MSATLPGANPSTLPPAILAQRYRLERRLAQGGMAEVWLATDLSLTRSVAVKLLKPTLAADPVVAERFRREAIAVAQLNHPNIVAVYDAIEEQIGGDRRQAVVMQLVNGKSLRQLLDEQKRLSPDLTMHIGACVASALDCAHHANLVHRDVKPGNILITPDGRVLLTDFGIAKGLTGTSDDDLTSPNVMMGTAKYLSPEQVRGKRLDGRADLYSLGLVLYECLAGRVPFLGETDTDTALARLNRDPTDLTRLRPTLPDGLAPLIHRLLSRKPDDRYHSGAEVRAELQRIAALPRNDLTTDGSRPVPGVNDTRATPTGFTRPRSATTTAQMASTPGNTPVRAGRPAGSATRVDRTPPSPLRPRQQPNRKFEHRRGPSMVVVGGLLVAAFVVGLVLWITMGTSTGSTFHPATTTAATQATTGASTSPGGKPAPVGPSGIASVRTFDPDGDGQENDQAAANAIDRNMATAWTTVCYSSRYMGGKRGVGLIADLGSARTGMISIAVGNGPFQLRVYASAADQPPGSFADWGQPLHTFGGDTTQTITQQITTPARWVLVSFTEIGRSPACSSNPYRGAIQELSFA